MGGDKKEAMNVQRVLDLETRVREAEQKDLPFIKKISEETFTGYSKKLSQLQIDAYFKNPKKYDVWKTSEVIKNKVLISQKFFVIEDFNGKVFGYTGIESINFDGECEGTFWINWTAIHPRCQKKGYGRKLLTELIKHLKNAGGRILNVKTESNSESACRVYEKLGFKRTGRIPKYYEDGCDMVIYSLNLKSVKYC